MKLDKPSWANWKAMDANSSWCWYAEKPYVSLVLMSWVKQSRKGLAYRIKTHPITHIDSYWKDTLTYVGEEMKDMKLKDLKAGMRIETRNGEQGLLVNNGGGNLYLLLSYDCSSGVKIVDNYKPDLTIYNTSSLDHHKDIMKVWDAYSVAGNCDLSKEALFAPYWERKEVKELTVAEIEKLLGHSVKIVK